MFDQVSISFHQFSQIIFAGILSLALFYFLFFRKRKRQEPPGLKPTGETVGNVPDIDKAGSLHEFLAKLHQEFGPVASFWYEDTKVVSTAHVNAFLPQKHLFNRPHKLYKNLEPLLGCESVHNLNYEEGREMRHSLDTAFSHQSCAGYLPTMVEAAEEIAREWSWLQGDEPVPLRECMLSLAMKALLRSCFGDYFTDNDACHRFEKNYHTTFRALDQLQSRPDMELGQEFHTSKDEMYNEIREIVAHRRENLSGEELLIDKIINSCSSEQQILLLGLTYIIGGFHTTGIGMTWMFYYLSKNPECQNKIFEEYKRVLGEEEIFPGAIQELKYTKQVINETMRLSQLAPYAARFSDEDLVIGNFIIPKYTPILQALGVAHHDETEWKEPKKFDPARFENKVESVKCPLFGFAGKRKCPGYRFAYAEMFSFLSVLIRKFEVCLLNPDQVVTPLHGLVTSPSEEIYVLVKKRS